MYVVEISDVESDSEALRPTKTFKFFCNNVEHSHSNLADQSIKVSERVEQKIIDLHKEDKKTE